MQTGSCIEGTEIFAHRILKLYGMSRERRYQQGDFENYYPGRHALDEQEMLGESDNEYSVRRGDTREVGGVPEREGQPRPASHRGKGPRDYRRRDERILEDINDRLCDNAYIDASEMEVSVSSGDVVLAGRVEDRESKRLAEDIAESVAGVQNVENRLRVAIKGI